MWIGWSEALRLSVTSFSAGGTLCALAQILIDKTKLTPARILVVYAVTGVAVGAAGWFEPLAAFAGCGVTVPLIGFGGNIARGMREAVATNGWLGVLTGAFSAASAGCAAALIFGYLACLFSSGKPKHA